MKKIYIFIFLAVFTAGWISCSDNSNFSNVHNLTDEEIAELARQDSIEEAQKNSINANLILEYSVDVTVSQTLYDGTTLAIDIDQIAEIFGISEEELLAGIAGESGAPEVKGFAIDGTTHADYGSASTSGSTWGHWWDANGDVTEWGSTTALAVTYAEFDYETGEFYIGQYPARLSDGQTITIIEALKYNEIRVAVVITVNAKAAGEVTATVVSTQELSIDVTPQSSYDAVALQFDLTQALSDLGVSSMEEVSFLGVNEDGSYNQEPVTGNGFWHTLDGYVGTYGDDGVVYTNYGDFSDDEISIGQYPDILTVGQSLTIYYGLLANSKIVMLDIRLM